MKNKNRFLGSSLALMFALPLTFAITSCNGNNVKHNFSENWETSDSEHWHKCLDEGCTEKDAIAPHDFTWEAYTEPGTHVNKQEKGTCKVCKYVGYRTIDNTLTHTYDLDNWEKDATGHWHKSTCDEITPHEHSSLKIDFAEHTFGPWTKLSEATLHTDEVEHRLCTVCNFEEKNNVEGTATHSWKWAYDLENHWEESTCDHEEKMIKNKEAHTTKYVVIDGGQHKKVTSCDVHEEVTIQTSNHVYASGSDICKDCGYIRNPKVLGGFLEISDKTFTGSPISLVAEDYTINQAYKDICEIQYKEQGKPDTFFSTTGPKNVGTYDVRIYCKGNQSCSAGVVAAKTFNVIPFPVTIEKYYERSYNEAEANNTALTYKVIARVVVKDDSLNQDYVLDLRANDAKYKAIGRYKSVPLTDLVFNNPNFKVVTEDSAAIEILIYDDQRAEMTFYSLIHATTNYYKAWEKLTIYVGSTSVLKKGILRVGDFLTVKNSELNIPLKVVELRDYNNYSRYLQSVIAGEKFVIGLKIKEITDETTLKSKLNNKDAYSSSGEELEQLTTKNTITGSSISLQPGESRIVEFKAVVDKSTVIDLSVTDSFTSSKENIAYELFNYTSDKKTLSNPELSSSYKNYNQFQLPTDSTGNKTYSLYLKITNNETIEKTSTPTIRLLRMGII